MKKAIFLDRDGVLNLTLFKDGEFKSPLNLDELKIVPNIKETLFIFKKYGYLLILVTNQPDVARGKNTKQNVEEINNYLKNYFNLDAIYVCYHDNNDFCDCRKPKPGMIINASKKYNIDLTSSFMIGDRWRDVEAGKNAKCKTILIDYKYKEQLISQPDYKIISFTEAKKIVDKYQ